MKVWLDPEHTGGPSQDGGSQEDPLEMEGAWRPLSGWRGKRTLFGWREPDNSLRMEGALEKEESPGEGGSAGGTPATAASLQERLQGISLGDYLQPISWASRLFRWWISNAILSCIQPSRFFYAELIKIRSHPDHWWMEAVPGSTGEHSSLVGM